MPVIKSAKKKLRQDLKKQQKNKKLKNLLKDLIKRAIRSKEGKQIITAVKTADKAAKNHIIHRNKADRIKSQLYSLKKLEKITAHAPKKTKIIKKTS